MGAGFRAVEMGAADVARLAAFFAGNPEYHLVISGAPAAPAEAQEEFDSLPPAGFPYERKWMLLYEGDDGAVIGMASLLQDLFAPGIWNIGLFIAATALHGTGRPKGMYHAMEEWMASEGASWLRLGVVEPNPRAAAFWRRVGYSHVRIREDYEIGGRKHRLHVMAKPLAEADWMWYLQAVPRDNPCGE
jgi:RimJ/RimL family protein N-acetyltransferase